MKKEQLDHKIFDLYDDYAHSKITRREFVEKLSLYAVGGITVGSLMSFLLPNYNYPVVSKADPRLKCDYIEYESPKGAGKMKAQLCLPADATKKLPGIIVVHENRGLNPYIEDVGRQAALAGFISVAPDALTPFGGYPGDDDKGRELQRQRDSKEILEDFIAAFKYLESHPGCNGKIGVVGFCFGGWVSNMLAVKLPELKAAVPFYGRQPEEADVPSIVAPLLLQYAGNDQRVNEGWPAYEQALKKYNKSYEAHVYPNVDHGFHNNTTPRYNEEAAKLAWDRTIDFFNSHLK